MLLKTGAVFSAEEVKQRLLSKSSENEPSSGRSTPQKCRKDSTNANFSSSNGTTTSNNITVAPTTAAAAGGTNTSTDVNNSSSGGGSGGSNSNGTGNVAGATSAAGKKTFQSRFLGKPSTTVETKESTDSASSSSESEEEEDESSSESSDEDNGTTTTKKSSAGTTSGSSSTVVSASANNNSTKLAADKTSRMEKTDIGPLLAKSANARDTSKENNAISNYNRTRDIGSITPTSSSVAAYRRTRDAVARVTSPPERETGRYSSSHSTSSNVTSPANNT